MSTTTAYTQRVKVGAYYTDGNELWEVVKVHALGSVTLRNTTTGQPWSLGIGAFRRTMWLAKASGVKP